MCEMINMEFILPRFMKMYLGEKESNNFKELFEEGFKDKEEEIFKIERTIGPCRLLHLNRVIDIKINLKSERDKELLKYMDCWSFGVYDDFGAKTYHELIRSGKLKANYENELGLLINSNHDFMAFISPMLYTDYNKSLNKVEFVVDTVFNIPIKYFPYSDEMRERLDKINKEKGIEIPSIMSFEPR